MDLIKKIDAKISTLENTLKKLKTFRSQLLDPELADVVGTADEFAVEEQGESLQTVDSSDAKAINPNTIFGKVVGFFNDRRNSPATAREIRVATGLTRGALSGVMYSIRKDEFERIEDNGEIRWKLRVFPYPLKEDEQNAV